MPQGAVLTGMRHPWQLRSRWSRLRGTVDKKAEHQHLYPAAQGEERKEKAHLEGHDTGVPALSLGLRDARAERRGVHEAVRRVSGGAGLADDELVDGHAVLDDLE